MREYSTLTREEKRQKKEAAMLGLATSAKRKAPTLSSSHQSKKTMPAATGLVPLGTHKRDTRSVDEIERDLAASKRAKMSMHGKESHRGRLLEEERKERELESMLRRTKAMQEKRAMEEKTQRDNYTMGSESNSSDDEERERQMAKDARRIDNSLKPKQNLHEPSRGQPSNSFGLSPADYLPGAPIKANMLIRKAFQAERPVKSKKEISRSVPEKIEPPKRETPRDKFLREEAEKKRKQSEREKRAKKATNFTEDDSDDEDEDSEEDSEQDSSESEEEEEEDVPPSKRNKVSEEIWKMFNRRDKSEYLARDVDSDDDMEVDVESLRREEERSARLARLEDKREEEALRRREQEKAQRKAAKANKH
jgi:protein SPT2